AVRLNAFWLLFRCHADHRIVHSFPTRRSSDLNRPMQRRRWIEGRGQIVAQRGAERRLVTGLDPEGVDQRRRMRARRRRQQLRERDRKSTRLNSSHVSISYAVFCLKKKQPPFHS